MRRHYMWHEITGVTDSRDERQLWHDLIQLELLMEGFGYKIAWSEQARVIRRELLRRDCVPFLDEWFMVPLHSEWDVDGTFGWAK